MDSIPIKVSNLTMSYGQHVVQKKLSFTVQQGDIFIIMGDSGCGKSTLLKHMVGLLTPAAGKITINGMVLTDATGAQSQQILRECGILYQKGALWSYMTLAENIALPLETYTNYSKKLIDDIVDYKLSLVGLHDFKSYYPYQLSGGMQKRAGLARAIALDPKILFFDEPSAGLDPISAQQLDKLIVELKSSMDSTIVVVTHELSSIFSIGTNSIFLDAQVKTITARGNPNDLLHHTAPDKVKCFLSRSGTFHHHLDQQEKR